MPFTSTGYAHYGKFSVQEYPTYASPAIRGWISREPAGDPVSILLSVEGGNLLTEFLWINTGEGTDSGLMGGLDPDTQYYFNLQHVDPDQQASIIKREVIGNPPQTVEQTPNVTNSNYPISDSSMNQTLTTSEYFWIPSGDTISSPFTSSNGDTAYGRFVFHVVPGYGNTPATTIWISETPNGLTVGGEKFKNTNALKATEVRFQNSDNGLGWQTLESGKQYYLNIKHTDPNAEPSYIQRLVKMAELGEESPLEFSPFNDDMQEEMKICLF